MADWRDHILQHFQEPIYRLTLVADPDGLLLEEELLATIRTRLVLSSSQKWSKHSDSNICCYSFNKLYRRATACTKIGSGSPNGGLK
jgi:hypothetical protein